MKNQLTVNDKIIFLDIDGVLNSPLYMIHSKEGSRSLDPVNIKALNGLIARTGAKVVLSSTWRYNSTPEAMTELLQEKGFAYDIHSFTPDTRSACRGVEIKMWMDAHVESFVNFHEYVILDDDSDMLWEQRENFILCPQDTGLTPNLAYKAWRLMMSKRNWIEPDHNYEDDFGLRDHLDQWTLQS